MPHLRPFVSAVVRPIPITTRDERLAELDHAGYNPFNIRGEKVSIDLLSDSGTGAVSTDQQACAQRADERYAGAESWYRFRDAVRELLPHQYILPTHQGRGAERVLFAALLQPGQLSLSNGHFDTTRSNVERRGGEARDLFSPTALDLASAEPFKGDIDLEALKAMLGGPDGDRVGQIVITVTNNLIGGHPVRMANLRTARDLARKHRVPLVLDAARFAENAWLVTRRDPDYAGSTPAEVAREVFDCADAVVASLKKDGLSHGGAFVAVREAELAERCEAEVIATEGFRTYGGLTGHTLEQLAQGLREVVDPHYLADREHEAAYLADQLDAAGAVTLRPHGCSAVFIDAAALLPHLEWHELPDLALACELYARGGVRAGAYGSSAVGELGADGELVSPGPFDLVRLALPRRVYDHSHWEYVADVVAEIAKNPEQVPGYRLTHVRDELRHFAFRAAPRD